MRSEKPRNKPLVLTRQTIRLLSDSTLRLVVGGGGVAIKQTQAGATCGDCYG